MKRKIKELISFMVLAFSLFYIYGQAGLIDEYKLSITDGSVRIGIAIMILALDTWHINRHWNGEEWI